MGLYFSPNTFGQITSNLQGISEYWDCQPGSRRKLFWLECGDKPPEDGGNQSRDKGTQHYILCSILFLMQNSNASPHLYWAFKRHSWCTDKRISERRLCTLFSKHSVTFPVMFFTNHTNERSRSACASSGLRIND